MGQYLLQFVCERKMATNQNHKTPKHLQTLYAYPPTCKLQQLV